ncbi:MAG: GNAT family N-acetyltransferase [Ruminococcaceae bacterium]|nr:GNAT family N-acetyltransferase [Oscillospiraceae bacterium]
MKFEKIFAGQHKNEGYNALWNMVKDELPDESHTKIIRRRLQGEFADLCTDNYYIAYEDDVCYSRLWTGWGKHKDAIGNFGHFLTLPEKRGQGLGREVIKKWTADIKSRGDAPLALFCTATAEITEIYRPLGFREITPEAKGGFLYCPLGNSPETFKEFCDDYFVSGKEIYQKPASMEYRHELDCLLRFAFFALKEEFTMGGSFYVEDYFVKCPEKLSIFFDERNHVVGWGYEDNFKIHPAYRDCKIIKRY